MTIYLKQSTASQEVPLGYFVDSTDGNTEMTALTIANTDIKIWKTGATTLANKNSGGATHISNGIYYAVLDATDTNTLGSLVIYVHVSGALAVRVECVVLAANVYDSLIGGGDLLDVNVSQFGNTNGTFASGRPEVNTTHAAGTAWGSGAITAASIASSAITSAKFATGAITATVIAADAIGASELAADAVTEIATGVWAAATRTLSAGTNIVLAKGTGVTGFNDLDAAGVRGAVGLASANLDTQLSTIDTEVGVIDGVVDAIKVVTDKLDTALVLDGSVYQYTANALELAPSGGGGLTAADVRIEMDANSTKLADILTDTGTTIPAQISALNNLSAAQVNAEVDTALSDVGLTTTITGRIDAAISTRLASASYTAPDNASISAIKAKTDNLTFTVSGQVDANTESMNGAEVLGNGTSGDLWRG